MHQWCQMPATALPAPGAPPAGSGLLGTIPAFPRSQPAATLLGQSHAGVTRDPLQPLVRVVVRAGFFEQDCKLFHQRPFIWHIWDGRKDGFSVLVNYHKLDAARLDKLIDT
jgi:hypothetical protein